MATKLKIPSASKGKEVFSGQDGLYDRSGRTRALVQARESR